MGGIFVRVGHQPEHRMNEKESAMATTTYTVTGMTCGHCASSVKEEIGKIDGVTSVDVDLASGLVKVDSAVDLARTDVAAAVDEAGYELS